MKSRICLALVAAASIAAVGGVQLSGQRAAPPLTGGNGTLYIGGYPNVIWIIDEATEKVVGTIQTKSGIPRRLTLSRDQKRFIRGAGTPSGGKSADRSQRPLVITGVDAHTIHPSSRALATAA